MAIQWFPGHMTRARRQIEDKLKLIDVAIELLDSRLPISSRNPMIDDILRDKPRLIILNKADLADPEATRKWLAYFKAQGHVAYPVDASTGTGIKEIRAGEAAAEGQDRPANCQGHESACDAGTDCGHSQRRQIDSH